VVVASDPETTVNEAVWLLRNGASSHSTIVWIDPGDEPGIAVVSAGIVEAVYRAPLGQVVTVVEKIKKTHPQMLVRIGRGARLVSTYLANNLVARGIAVELVDESRTSPARE
jgi:hypothetical protein